MTPVPDHPLVARLRKDAAIHRKVSIPPEYGGGVQLYPEEADALADAVEALAEFMGDGMPQFEEQSWYDEEGVEGTQIMVYGHGWEARFRAVLAALDRATTA